MGAIPPANQYERLGRRAAFTLVELLVVLAIIVVLVSMLLPALGRVRNQIGSVTCLNNLKQLGAAMTAYLGDNGGNYPKPAVTAVYENWVYWNGGQNPANGRIVPYFGGLAATTKVLTCPANAGNTYVPSYPYSYSVNEYMCRYYENTINVRQVLNPSGKILAVCESSQTIDDGCWASQNYLNGTFVNLLSNRHDMRYESRYDYLISDDLSGRGAVVFVDGHSAFISRANSLDPNFYMAFPTQPVR
jgi:prepilin-type N-terminal cleavage/methylation domain-containing protein